MNNSPLSSRIFPLLILISAATLGSSLYGQTIWKGNFDSWNINAPWTNGIPNSENIEVIFYQAGASNLTTNSINNDRSIGALTYNADADADVSITLANSILTMGGATNITPLITVNAGATGNFLIYGAITSPRLNINGNLSIMHNGSGTLTISAPIRDDDTNTPSVADSLTKSGSGTLILSAGAFPSAGPNTYTGGTTVNGGTLALSGNGTIGTVGNLTMGGGTLDISGITPASLTMADGRTVSGTGTINATGKTFIVNGALNPGNSPGVLEVTGNLTLGSTAVSTMEIDGATRGTQYDGLDVTGSLVYGGSLVLDLGTTFGNGNYSFDIFDQFSGQSGAFSAVNLTGNYTGAFSNNSGIWTATTGDASWAFTQGTGILDLTVVPEPSTSALLAAGLVVVVAFRRRRLA